MTDKKLINDVKRGPLANVVTLHDFGNSKPNLKLWFEYVVKFFKDYHVIPTRMSGINREGKTVSFKLGKKQHEEIDFNVDIFWMGATPPNHAIDGADSIFSTDFTLDPKRTNFVLCFDNQIVPFQKGIITKLATDLALIFEAKYGYAYQRLFKQGPSYYPNGTISGLDRDKDRVERELITQWGIKYGSEKYYKTGDLRDIYPMNLLVNEHLKRQVIQNQTLETWIKSDKSHGELEELAPGKFAWWVEQENILLVREVLRPSGIIIAG